MIAKLLFRTSTIAGTQRDSAWMKNTDVYDLEFKWDLEKFTM